MVNILSFLRNGGSALKQPVQLRSQTVAAKIVELFWLFVGKEHNPTEVAAMLVSLYKKASWKDLVEIDLLFRKNSYYNYSSFLRLGDPVAAFLEGLPKECESVVLRLCTCAPNGYFREKALLAIESLEDELVLPFLLLRLNDWVEPVQQRAKQSLEKRITAKNARCFIDYYGLIEKARRSQRNCNSAICQNIDQLLRAMPLT